LYLFQLQRCHPTDTLVKALATMHLSPSVPLWHNNPHDTLQIPR